MMRVIISNPVERTIEKWWVVRKRYTPSSYNKTVGFDKKASALSYVEEKLREGKGVSLFEFTRTTTKDRLEI